MFVYGGDAERLTRLDTVFVADAYPGAGPVGGVLGALDHLAATSPTGTDVASMRVFVLACDLALVTAAELAALLDAADTHPEPLVWVGSTSRLEPMCALWSMRARSDIAAAFESGERALHRIISGLDHVTVPLDDHALRNINAPDDLPG